jgi:hypothetical protein
MPFSRLPSTLRDKFTHPTLSLPTIGAFALAAFMVCLSYLIFAAFHND